MSITTNRDPGPVARLIRARRYALGLTQEQLARKLNVTTNTVARWERGAEPSRLHRTILAAHLGGEPADYRGE